MPNKHNNQRGYAHKSCARYDKRNGLSPELERLVAILRRQLVLRAKGKPIVLSNCNNTRPNTNVNANPTVMLPLGLGSIIVPTAARHVDVRFNCVSSRLPTGHITHRLVVNVDVTYNPATDEKSNSDSSDSKNFPDTK